MLKIGEFSRIAQVSVKTLRHYDEMGLIKPAHIDRYTGYRYYNLNQLDHLNRILALKDLDFSLDQIKALLNTDLRSASLEIILQNKAADLRQRVCDDQSRLKRIENKLDQLRDNVHSSQNPIVVKTASDLFVATIRQVIPSTDFLIQWQTQQTERISRFLKEKNEEMVGPQILIFHQDEYRDCDVDVETGLVIGQSKDPLSNTSENNAIRVYLLEGVAQMATTVYSQDLTNPSEAYTQIAEWTQVNGFRTYGPWREIIYQQHQPFESKIIEVQHPILHASQYYKEMEIREMEPKIITYPSFTLVGMRYYGKNENQEIARLWGEFNQRIGEIGGLQNETGDAAIGLCVTPENAPSDGSFEYVAGFPVSQVGVVPEGFVVREIPAHTYAVFAHKGSLAGLGKTYEFIYETWLPQSGYQVAAKLDFEYYDQDFKNFEPDSIFYIYVPIEKA